MCYQPKLPLHMTISADEKPESRQSLGKVSTLSYGLVPFLTDYIPALDLTLTSLVKQHTKL